MGIVVPFPGRQPAAAFGAEDCAALDRLVARLRRAGAVGWEIERRHGHARAYILGAEDETLLMVAKSGTGIAVFSGYAHELLWQGDKLANYA